MNNSSVLCVFLFCQWILLAQAIETKPEKRYSNLNYLDYVDGVDVLDSQGQFNQDNLDSLENLDTEASQVYLQNQDISSDKNNMDVPPLNQTNNRTGRQVIQALSRNLLCGSATEPRGECLDIPTCIATGGLISTMDQTCGSMLGFSCCVFEVNCVGQVTSRTAVWQSRGYPQNAVGPKACRLIVRPLPNVCYIKVKFTDTQLTAGLPNSCSGNMLTITNQAEGQSSVICGSLHNYETMIKVRNVTVGFVQVRYGIRLLMNVQDTSYRFNIGITQVLCSQVENIIESTFVAVTSEGKQSTGITDEVPAGRSRTSISRQIITDKKIITSPNPSSTIDVNTLISLSSGSGILDQQGSVKVDDLCEVATREATQRIYLGPVKGTLLNGTASYFGTVIIRNEHDIYVMCGATLIHPYYVLTSASCLLRNGFNSKMYDIRTYFDPTLEHKLPDAPRTWKDLWDRDTSFEVEKVVFHPMYDHDNFFFDIAVMRLKTPVRDNVPIGLPDPEHGENFNHLPVVEMGHGATSVQTHLTQNSFATHAVVGRGVVVPRLACNAAYNNVSMSPTTYNGERIKEQMMCIELEEVFQACEGDQGGPVVSGFDSKFPVLVGLLSGNRHNCIDPYLEFTLNEFPDIAVRISAVLDFISAATTDIQFRTTNTNG